MNDNKCEACNGTGECALLISTYPCDVCNGTGQTDVLPPLTGPARTSLTELGALVVPEYRDRQWWYHQQIAEALEGLLRYVRFKGQRGGYARVAISMPPQHGKSLHGTELFPAFALGQDPDLRIIVASNGATLAKKGIDNTRTWMDHPAYKATFATRFGKVEEFDIASSKRTRVLEVESSSQFFKTIKPAPLRGSNYRLDKMVEGHGYYLAQGIGGSLTGWGYDIGIGDDFVKNAEQALSPRHREKLWEFYTSTFATRQRGEFAGQVYIGTRWTQPDFADELIDYWEAQSTATRPLPIKVIRLPALADGDIELAPDDPRRDPAFMAKTMTLSDGRVVRYGAGLDKPSHRSQEYYEGERAGLMSTTSWVWFGMYQQAPKLAGTKFFQPHEWLRFDETFKLRGLHRVDISLDANLSETGASRAVIQVTGVLHFTNPAMPNEEGEHYFVLDESVGHYSYDELEREYLRLCRKWSTALPSQFQQGSHWVENKALGPTLINKFQGRFPIVAVPKAKAKIYCYRVAAQVTERMRVRIPSGTWGKDPTNPALPLITDAWVGDAKTKGSWIHEQAGYPSKPDDRRDTLAQQIICRTHGLGMDLLAAT